LSIQKALNWADKIFILDNGSYDGAELILDTIQSDRVLLYGSTEETYKDSFRQRVFESFRHELNDGDWVAFLITDEFFIDDPRVFLSDLNSQISVVYGLNVEYQFTEDNLENSMGFDFDNFEFFKLPSCEIRFFKYRNKLRWNENDSLPKHIGIPSTKMLPFAHYQFRKPDQITTKLNDRFKALNNGYSAYWERDIGKTWNDKLTPKTECFRVENPEELRRLINQVNIRIPESNIVLFFKYILHALKIWA
jgi:hypothetical protein